MFANGGEIKVKAPRKWRETLNQGQQTMSGIGRKADDAKSATDSIKNDDRSRTSPPKVSRDDEVEDGDIATPKRDRDDEQQGL
jgi:hypothetical protein